MNRNQCGRCNRTVSDREMAMIDEIRLRSGSTLPGGQVSTSMRFATLPRLPQTSSMISRLKIIAVLNAGCQ